MAQGNNNISALKRLREHGNVFLALFGAVAIVGIIGGTAAGIMKGPMKVMSDVSSRAVAENEIMANTKMGIMAISQGAFTKDCDNDGTVEAYPYNSSAVGKTGGVPAGGGYLPSEIDTTRWTDPWGNSYTYCVWDHGTLIDDVACGGAGQNRLPGLNKTTFPASDVNKQTLVAVLSAGSNRVYETTCQDWATADANNDGDLLDVGDTPLANKPTGSDDIVMSYTYAEAAMATSSNWRIQSTTTDTAEITEDEVEIGGQTAAGDGVTTTIGGSVMALGGLKLSTDPGDDSISGACNAANDQALRVNTGGASKALEICDSGTWTPISGSSTTASCSITVPVIANGGNAWVTDAAKLNGAKGIAIRNNYAYVISTAGDSLTVVDISDPLNPVIANDGNAWVTDAVKLNNPLRIDVSGNYAYITSSIGNSLTVIDISDPLNPVIANGGNAWITDAVKLNTPRGVTVSNNYAYVVSTIGNSFTVIDISDPLNPVIANAGNAWVTDAVKLNGPQGNISISDNYAYVATSGGNSLTVIDISDPLNPVIANGGNAWVTDAVKLNMAQEVAISGNYAYVTSSPGNSLTVIDISDPLNPVIANGGNAWINDAIKLNVPRGVSISGNYAYVTSAMGNSFTVIDISDPLNPVIANAGNAWVTDAIKLYITDKSSVSGQYAYVTSLIGDSLTVIDLGCDPTNPAVPDSGTDIGFDPYEPNCVAANDGPFQLEATQTGMGGNVYDMGGDGTYIYAGHNNTIRAYTFDGSAFTEVGSRDTGTSVETIFTKDGFIYVANWWQGIEVLTFDGTNFTVVDTYGGLGNTRGVWSDGETVFLYTAGTVNAFSFDGTSLTLLTSLGVGGNQIDLWVDGDYIYLGDYDGAVGLIVVKWDGSAFTLVDSIDTFQGSIVRTQDDYIFLADTFSGLRAYTLSNGIITDLGESPENLISTKLENSGVHLFTDNNGASLYAYTYDENGFDVVSTITATAKPLFYDGTYVFTAGGSELRAYSGFECTKAGEKTPNTSTQIDYTTEQLFSHSTSADSTAETYGTSILLKASEFASEAGVSFNVGSVLGDDETPLAAITGARVGIAGEGALLFKTKEDSGDLVTQAIIDSDGDLGLGTEAPFNVSGQIQIGELASSGSDFFNPETANCVANNSGPFVEVGTYDTIGNARGVWGDGTYIYSADGANGLNAFSFDGAGFSLINNSITTGYANSIWGDGTYIYSADGATGIRALTFDGTTLTEVGSFNTPNSALDVWGDGNYIYVADRAGGIRAFTFDGTTFTQIGSSSTSGDAWGVWGDGTYIYVGAFTSGIEAFAFDGTSFTKLSSFDTPNNAVKIWGDGTYIYSADYGSGVHAFTFDGSTLVEKGSFDTVDITRNVWSDGNYIYVANSVGGIETFEFDGATFTSKGSFNTSGAAYGIWGDGTYIYIADDANGIKAYSGFECTRVDGWQGPTHGLLVNNDQEDGDGPFVEVESLTEGGYRQDVLYHDGYIFFPQNTGGMKVFKPYSDGILELVGNFATTGHIAELWSDGNYIYTAEGASGMRIYDFDGSSLTELDFYIGAKNMEDVWGDGTYIYSSERDALRAYTFDGITLTFINTGTPFGNAGYLWGDGTYIYSSTHSSGTDSYIRAYSFDGANFTVLNSTLRSSGVGVGKIYSDGTYIYSNSLASGGLSAYTFNGANFTEVQQIMPGTSTVSAVWGDGEYIYAVVPGTAANVYDLIAFTFDGSTVTQYGSIYSRSYSIASDGTYIYTATEGGRLNIYSGFAYRPISTAFFGNDGIGDVDTNILFSSGLDIKGTNPDGTTLTDILSVDNNGTATFQQGNVDLIDEAGAFEFLSSSYSASSAPTLILNRHNGTQAAPTTVNSGDIIGALMWAGHDGTGIAETTGNAAIYAKATGAPSNGIIPTGLFFSTDSAGNSLGSSDMVLLSTGLLGIGTESPLEELHVIGRISFDNGLRIGYDNDCNTLYDKGFMRYVTTSNSLEYCTAEEWISITQAIPPNPFDPEAANCIVNNGGPFVEVTSTGPLTNALGIWNDGTYTYVADNTSGLRVYSFDGTILTEIDNHAAFFSIQNVWGDGTYIYVANYASGVRAFTFDGSTLTEVGLVDTPGSATHIWGDGAYIYVADAANGIIAYTFNGTTFTQAGTFNTPDYAWSVWGDGTYIYVADGGGIRAYTFDGSTFTEVGSWTIADAYSVWGDGTYIYTGMGGDGISAFTFDGSTFTQAGWINTPDQANHVWHDGVYLYVVDGATGVIAYSFDGSTFTQVNVFNTDDYANAVWGDGSYVYIADGNAIKVYSGFECIEVKPTSSNQLIEWAGAENTELKITASDAAAGDLFGSAVSISGNYAIISARQGNLGTGSAYIFDIITGAELFKLTASDAAASDDFGYSVAISGNYAIIGARKDDDNGAASGSAYIFDVSTGAQLFKLTASNGAANDWFGYNVSIDGKYAIVGAFQNDENGADAGSAYIFDVTTGVELFKLSSSDIAAGDKFGYNVSIDGNYAIIGSRQDDDNGSGSGSAYIFDVTTGAEIQKLIASDGQASDFFGHNVAIEGNYAVIGANGDDDNGAASGSAYIFDITTGTELFKLIPSDAIAGDKFSSGISISNNYVIIGSFQDDDNGADSGSSYIFELSTGNELYKLTANDAAAGDNFGRPADIEGSRIIIAGNKNDDAGADSGSAYIYQGNWTQRHTSNTGCYPEELVFNDITGATASTATTTNTITLTGFVKDCTLSLSSESVTIDILKNTVSVGASYVDVDAGDTIQLEITSSATAGATYNNIVTLGDQRTDFTIRTAP